MRSNKTIISTQKHEIQRVIREHEADSYKVERINQVANKLEKEFERAQHQMMEMLGMHGEEYAQKNERVSSMLQRLDMKMNQVEHQNDRVEREIKSIVE